MGKQNHSFKSWIYGRHCVRHCKPWKQGKFRPHLQETYSTEETPKCKHAIIIAGDTCTLHYNVGCYWTVIKTSSSVLLVSGKVSYPGWDTKCEQGDPVFQRVRVEAAERSKFVKAQQSERIWLIQRMWKAGRTGHHEARNLNLLFRLKGGAIRVVSKDMTRSDSHFRKSSSALIMRKRRKFELLEIWWLESIQEVPWTMGSSRENKEIEKATEILREETWWTVALATPLDLGGGQSCPCHFPIWCLCWWSPGGPLGSSSQCPFLRDTQGLATVLSCSPFW